MLSQKIMHMLKKNEKIESFSKERDLKKNQMEILELKKYNNWNESSGNGLSNRMEGTEKRISELEDSIMEITHSEQERARRIKLKQNKTQSPMGPVGLQQKICQYVIRTPEAEEKEDEAETVLKEIRAKNYPNLQET